MENKCKECSYCNSPNSCKHCKVKGGRYDNFHPRKNKETSYLDYIPMFIQYAIGNTEEEKYSSAEKLAKIHFDKIIQEQKEKEEQEQREREERERLEKEQYEKEYALYEEKKNKAIAEIKPYWDEYMEKLSNYKLKKSRIDELKNILNYNKAKMTSGLMKLKDFSYSSNATRNASIRHNICQSIFTLDELGDMSFENVKNFCDNIDENINSKYGKVEDLQSELENMPKHPGHFKYKGNSYSFPSNYTLDNLACSIFYIYPPKNKNDKMLDLKQFIY